MSYLGCDQSNHEVNEPEVPLNAVYHDKCLTSSVPPSGYINFCCFVSFTIAAVFCVTRLIIPL